MSSLPTLNSIIEIKQAFADLNYDLKELQHYPTEEEKQTNIVFWTPKIHAGSKMYQSGYLGTLTFKNRLYDLYPNNTTKVLLSKWLNSSEWLDCPICTLKMTTCTSPKYNSMGCSSCGRCGFKTCVICILKSVLYNPCDIKHQTIWKCPNCRN
eukprot:860407_1